MTHPHSTFRWALTLGTCVLLYGRHRVRYGTASGVCAATLRGHSGDVRGCACYPEISWMWEVPRGGYAVADRDRRHGDWALPGLENVALGPRALRADPYPGLMLGLRGDDGGERYGRTYWSRCEDLLSWRLQCVTGRILLVAGPRRRCNQGCRTPDRDGRAGGMA